MRTLNNPLFGKTMPTPLALTAAMGLLDRPAYDFGPRAIELCPSPLVLPNGRLFVPDDMPRARRRADRPGGHRVAKDHHLLGVFIVKMGFGQQLRPVGPHDHTELLLEVHTKTRVIRRVLWHGEGRWRSPDRLYTVGNRVPKPDRTY